MQRCRATLMAVVAIGGFVLGGISTAPAHESNIPPAAVQWRRTVNGWERADLWTIGNLAIDTSNKPTAPDPPPGMHPILLAALLLAAAALLAMPSGDRR